MRALVTGGAGFIGSALIRLLLAHERFTVTNVDKLTYAANPASLADVRDSSRYRFVEADVCDRVALAEVFAEVRPQLVFHLAAESHVDRSIVSPTDFLQTNVVGTHTLLEEARTYWAKLVGSDRHLFRFVHVSTDEVFGSMAPNEFASEGTRYDPRSPYSASKAAADHFVRSAWATWGLPVLIAVSSNNYGPRQFPEKLIPLTIINALEGLPVQIYGDGKYVRDWVFVEDFVEALFGIATRGRVGETYCVSSRVRRENLEVAEAVCRIIDARNTAARPRRHLITFVADRPGHDRRYAIDPAKAEVELCWRPAFSFEQRLEKTVHWYLDNEPWWRPLRARYAGERLGLA